MHSNTSFDGKSHTFARNIYGTIKGEIRLKVVWRDLQELLERLPAGPLRILDAGGGFGPFSQRLAALGHSVVLCDLSAEMLAEARRQVAEKDLSHVFEFIHGPIQDLSVAELGRFDLILCHAVLEWVEDQAGLLATLGGLLREQGHLSLMYYNRDGLLFQSLVMGHFDYVEADLVKKRRQKLTPPRPCRPGEVEQWLAGLGFAITGRTGVRVLHDYMVRREIRTEQPGQLLEMELAHARQEPFVGLGRYIHVLAKKGD
ncbi:methyltransferase domain-containing protein [Zobellella aerophila]|uniref:tRNA 5-carboxymethoxyuridine methyltransferase n=1 Tax=Zobellella aerophila TaxID=870480 RepID=A0ABP6VCI7_9GAMM